MVNKKAIAIATIAVLLGYMSPVSSVLAANVSSLASASVSSDSFSGSSVSLPALVITEQAAADIPVGTLTWALPAGYVLDTSSVANVSYTGAGLNGSSSVSFPDSTHFSVSITSTSTTAGSMTIGSTTPLKVKVSAGTPLAAAGNITLSAGTIVNLATTTTFGALVQIPGAANKLVFTVQPTSNVTVNTAFSGGTVAVEDQFGNILTTDSGRTLNLAAAVVGSSTLGSLSWSASFSEAAGLFALNNLFYNQIGVIQLQASSSALSSAVSNNITVSNSAVTPPPSTCTGTPVRILPNGILVKVEGSDTVYMVVNNTLRPFNSPAIFHAKGKKFQDIQTISPETLAELNLGRPVGEGNDDDSTVVTPAAGYYCPGSQTTPSATTTTPPSLSNLPEGSVVKVPGDPTVYIVQNGQLHAIPSPSVFKAWKKNFQDVQTISTNQLQNMTVGQLANYPDGTLIQGNGPTIYVIANGEKKGIPNMETLRSHGWSINNTIRVNENEMSKIQNGGTED